MEPLDLEKIRADAEAEKKQAEYSNRQSAMLGALGDTFSNSQSIGNFALGRMNGPASGGARMADAMKVDVVDPSTRVRNLLDQYRGQKAIQDDEKADVSEKALKDPTSQQSQFMREALKSQGLRVPENASGFQLTSVYGKASDYALKNFENKQSMERDQAKFGNDQTVARHKSDADMRMKAFEQTGDTRLLTLKQQGEMSKQGMIGKQGMEQIGARGEQERLTKGDFSGTDKVKMMGEAPLGTKSTEFKMSKLNGTDKARLDNVRMAHEGINAMAGALNKGDSTWNLIGDNNFTMAERDFGEALGRMQSGGAISKPEEKRFLSMAPKAMDSPEIKAEKIANLQAEMGQRFKTLGFDQSEFGIKNVALNSPGSKSESSLVKTAVAGSAPSSADQAAITWAKSNSGDPRAKGILQKLKEKGVL